MDKREIFNLSFNVAPYNNFIEEIINRSKTSSASKYVCVANVHMLIESYLNNDFAVKVREADIVTPDGIPITWALKILHGVKQDRVAGMDILPDLLKRAEGENIAVYFYGGTSDMLCKTKNYVRKRYPALNIAGSYSPPFRELSREEEEEIVLKINESRAKIVFVVLGCPKQEKWMAAMKGRIHSTMIGIGGALPVLIGMQKRAPLWMQTSGLEWLFRLLQDPKRLWKRYFVTNSLFIYLLILSKAKESLIKRNIIYRKAIH